ncbi:MAG: YraN family protein [Nitrospinaceae bacterium]
MTQERLKFGKAGEEAAVAFLKKRGYRILKKNYRAAVGEIDIIAENQKVVVFIEVKSRANDAFGHPFLALTPSKQARLAKTARSFLAKHKIEGRDVRFDVVGITGSPENPETWKIDLLEDAFRL